MHFIQPGSRQRSISLLALVVTATICCGRPALLCAQDTDDKDAASKPAAKAGGDDEKEKAAADAKEKGLAPPERVFERVNGADRAR